MHNLDPEQQAVVRAVVAGEGHLRVPASAGSGKTRTLVASVAACLQAGVPPDRILVATFTRKAADEFQKRLGQATTPHLAYQVRVGTFHSLALRRLRADAHLLDDFGGPDGLDPTDHRSHWDMRDCMDVPQCRLMRPARLWSAIVDYSRDGIPGLGRKGLDLSGNWRDYANTLTYIRSQNVRHGTEAALRYLKDHRAHHPQCFSEAWDLFEAAKEALGAWDFADALDAYLDLVKLAPEYLERVLVDEAQDNDLVQAAIVEEWAQGCPVTLCGDGRQAIYAWRGARPEVFVQADKTLGAATLSIPTNYRSGARIVRAGAAAVDGQEWAVGDPPKPARDLEGSVELLRGYDSPGAAARGIERIAELHEAEGIPYDHFAILCRTNDECGLFEGVAMEQRVPVHVVGRSFWQAREVQDFLAYSALTQVDNPVAIDRIYNRPMRYIGRATMAKVTRQLHDGSLDVALRNVAMRERPNTARNLSGLRSDLLGLRALPSWEAQANQIARLLLPPPEKDDSKLEGRETDTPARAKLVEIAHTYAGYFDDGLSFVRYAEAALANSTFGEGGHEAGRVTVSTIHKAKGLEWPHVFVLATEGRLPLSQTPEDEERRLFYVAVTRAEDSLTLIYADQNGRGKPAGPSRFILEPAFNTLVSEEGQ